MAIHENSIRNSRLGRDVTSIVAALHASWHVARRSARGMCSMNTSSFCQQTGRQTETDRQTDRQTDTLTQHVVLCCIQELFTVTVGNIRIHSTVQYSQQDVNPQAMQNNHMPSNHIIPYTHTPHTLQTHTAQN